MVALFFTLTFGIVVLASLSQIWRINPFARTV